MSDTGMDFDPGFMKTHVAGLISVVRTARVTPHMLRVTFHGQALKGLEQYWRAEMLVRLYFPPSPGSEPAEPYIGADGRVEFNTTAENEVSPFSAVSEDPLVRAYTARQYRPESLELDIDFVLHEAPGLASDWARAAKPGDRLGIVEFALPPGHRPACVREADVYVLLADEAALPAAQTNFELFAPGTKVIAFLEVDNKNEEQPIRTKADLTVTWLHRNGDKAGTGGRLLRAIKELAWPSGRVFVWACCEIKTSTEIRRFVRNERGLVKGQYKAQAYWRFGKTEVERMARMTELTMADLAINPAAMMDGFEEIGMNVEDPTLFEEQR